MRMKKIIITLTLLLGVCNIFFMTDTIKAYTIPKTESVTIKGTTFSYTFHDKKKSKVDIKKIENPKKKLVIPAKLNGYPVYRIGGTKPGTLLTFQPDVIRQNSLVEELIIEDGIKEIGSDSFAFFEKLSSVTIPKSVKKIYTYAFSDNLKLKKLKIRNNEIEIGRSAFIGCKKLERVSFPRGEFTGKIGESAFDTCNLREIELPYMKKMKKQIGRFAFASNSGLKKVTFSSRYKKISIGRDWFTDCPRAQIIVGKQVKAFSSKVNANAGSVRLLGNQTKLTGFKKPKGKNYYYIQFKKFIVPEKSKALPILRKAKYGKVNDSGEERFDSDSNSYVGADMQKVKIVIK